MTLMQDLTLLSLISSSLFWTVTGVIFASARFVYHNLATPSTSQPDETIPNWSSSGARALPEHVPSPLYERLQHEPKPLPRRRFTRASLKAYNGTPSASNPDGQIYLAVRALVYDVSSAAGFYGPGAPYACFAGRDATVGLARNRMLDDDHVADAATDEEDFTSAEFDSLVRWETKLRKKYEIVGYLAN
ncbi:heme binding [Elasticomyces elasticus]|nr:hypothetical protein LTR28_008025 [Elasticomyces elasticus]KAK4958649.1 heme binding [Elasticomyces elasticus]KAK4983189.1 heme binding [Elasticomyces elasticus]